MKHFHTKLVTQAVMDSLQNKLTTMLTPKMLVIVNTESIFAVQTKFGNAEKSPKRKELQKI